MNEIKVSDNGTKTAVIDGVEYRLEKVEKKGQFKPWEREIERDPGTSRVMVVLNNHPAHRVRLRILNRTASLTRSEVDDLILALAQANYKAGAGGAHTASSDLLGDLPRTQRTEAGRAVALSFLRLLARLPGYDAAWADVYGKLRDFGIPDCDTDEWRCDEE